MAESAALRRTVKIESDGSPRNTKVTDVETGHELPVRGFTYSHDAVDIPYVELEIMYPTLEYQGLATIVLVDEFGDELEVQKKQ